MPDGSMFAARRRSLFASETDAVRCGYFLLGLLGNERAAERAASHGLPLLRAQSEGTNTAGGFLVPTQLLAGIAAVRDTVGTFRRYAHFAPLSSDSATWPRRTAGLTASFVAEAAETTESNATWDSLNFTAKKLSSLVRMSTEVAEDAAADVANYLAFEMGYAAAAKEDQCGWNGTGVAADGGIVGLTVKMVDGNHAAGAVAAIAGNSTFATLDVEDLCALIAALPAYALDGARWFINPRGYGLGMARLAGAAGGIQAMTAPDGSIRPFLMGFEVVMTPSLPSSVSALTGQAMIVFGRLDLAATLGDRRQMILRRTESRYMEYDQIGLAATSRVDVNVHDLGDGTTAGPVVALIGTA